MNTKIYKVGFWSGIMAFSANVMFLIAQTLQLM